MRTAIVFLTALPLTFGCTAPGPGAGAAAATGAAGPVVATVGDGAITLAAFEKHLEDQSPFIRTRYTTLDKKKEFLDGMIRFQLLADEARREGLDKDPDVQSTIEKVLVQKLIHDKFGDEGQNSLSEADLRAFYQQHLDEFVKPERLRLQIIEFGDGRSASRALAQLHAAEAKDDLAAFGTYAAAHSLDAATKGRNGDTDYKTDAELAAAYGPEVPDAAEKLQRINQTSDVVLGKGGAYLLRLIGRQAAVNRTFEQVVPALRSRLWHERQTKSFDDFVKKLRDDAHVKIDDAQLAKADATVPDLGANGKGLHLPIPFPAPPPVAATAPGGWSNRSLPHPPAGYHPPSPPPPAGTVQGR